MEKTVNGYRYAWVDLFHDQGADLGMVIFSPKMNRHKHRRECEIPLFPLLSAELDKLRSIPGNEKQEYVINCYSNRESVNLVRPFTAFVKRTYHAIETKNDGKRS